MSLSQAIFTIGIGQFFVLIASALVPVQLDWKSTLSPLPVLVRQLFWIYGGYVVMAIIALATICLVAAGEIASGTVLARAVSAYGLIFWGVRVSLQPFLSAKPHLKFWWLHAGYHLLTVMFLSFMIVFAWATFH
ncbi:hypothetical protein SH668x_003032 [Planctomicrobium sp. SH668]|uniref:hypothetical protein n=1 Tax=Planctomicrobium sp. SH668 TaxID=3448126 RepID=UPI003F5B2C55